MTTHYIEEAEEIAERVGIMDKGELLLVEEKKDQLKFDSLVRRLQAADLADLKIIEDMAYDLDDVDDDVEIADTLTILEQCVSDFENKEGIFKILKSLYMEASDVCAT